jgi:hypothetical protein
MTYLVFNQAGGQLVFCSNYKCWELGNCFIQYYCFGGFQKILIYIDKVSQKTSQLESNRRSQLCNSECALCQLLWISFNCKGIMKLPYLCPFWGFFVCMNFSPM